MSDDWESPGELLEPVQSMASNLAIRILSNPVVGHDVRILLGRFITEQSQFVTWFLDSGKSGSRDFREVLALTGFGDEQTMVVYEAWKKYEAAVASDPCDGKLNRVIAANAGLVSALELAVAALSRIRTTG